MLANEERLLFFGSVMVYDSARVGMEMRVKSESRLPGHGRGVVTCSSWRSGDIPARALAYVSQM